MRLLLCGTDPVSAEMKHGPIALTDPKTPTAFLVPQDSMYDKTMANLAMIRACKGPIIALAGRRLISLYMDFAEPRFQSLAHIA
jgi:glucosamine 6-phosphate synthetase-like amidotransferase/phosphosugar isomerase protein